MRNRPRPVENPQALPEAVPLRGPQTHDPLDAARAQTLAYYETNARRYVEITRDLNMETAHRRLTKHLRFGARILDAGCGSGRDAAAFLRQSFVVEACDASPALAAEAATFLGLPVRVGTHETMADQQRYDGIWASATFLHVRPEALADVMRRYTEALVPGGVLYASWKVGETDGPDALGRWFTNMTPERAMRLVEQTPGLRLLDLTIEADGARADTQWLAMVAQRIAASESASPERASALSV